MTQKPCACFGYILLQNTYPKDSVYEVQTSATSNTVLFLTKGHMVFNSKETGETLDEYFPGAFGAEWADNLAESVAVEESVVFCLTPKLNRGYVPDTVPVVMQADEDALLKQALDFSYAKALLKLMALN